MLIHMLHMLQQQQSNCTLVVTDPANDADGYLYIQDGTLVAASMNNVIGVDAAAEMVAWDEPEIAVYALPQSVVANVPPDASEQWFAATPDAERTLSGNAPWANAGTMASAGPALARRAMAPEASTHASPQAAPESPVQAAITNMLAIDGAVRAAVVEWVHGVVLGTMTQGLDADVAAAGNANVMRIMHALMQDLGSVGRIEDVVITLDGHYHLVHALEAHPHMCMYLVLDREYANLGLARYRLEQIEHVLVV